MREPPKYIGSRRRISCHKHPDNWIAIASEHLQNNRVVRVLSSIKFFLIFSLLNIQLNISSIDIIRLRAFANNMPFNSTYFWGKIQLIRCFFNAIRRNVLRALPHDVQI